MSAAELYPRTSEAVDVDIALLMGRLVAMANFASKQEALQVTKQAVEVAEQLVQLFDSSFELEEGSVTQIAHVAVQGYQRRHGLILPEAPVRKELTTQYRVPC